MFVFFGLVATAGTAYVQGGTVPGWLWAAAGGVGLIACSLLMVNNLRDIDTDPAAGKRTLAVRLGAGRARAAFIAMLWAPVAAGAVAVVWAHRALGGSGTVWLVALAVVIAVLGAAATRAGGTVLAGATGRALIPALRDAGLYELLYGVALAAALVLASR
mgnify:FL=1